MDRRGWAILYGFLGLFVISLALSPDFLGLSTQSSIHLLIDLVVNLGTGLGLLYGAHWHWKCDLDYEHYLRIGLWMLLSTALLLSLGVIILFLGSETVLPHELLVVLQVNLGFGLLAGLLFGTIRSLTIQKTRAAARAEAEAEALESERRRMAELNGLLRHYILNAINVIVGHASLIAESGDAAQSQSGEVINSQAQKITDIIENLKLISDVGPTTTRSVDLDQLIRHAKERTIDTGSVTFEFPTSHLQVRGNSSLEDAFRILCDVLTDVTEPGGAVTVSVDLFDEDVVVTAKGYPASFPPEIVDAMFEPIGTNHGLKLFMASKIVNQFGQLTFDESDEDTVAFECRLQISES